MGGGCMHKASPVELRTSIEMANWSQVCANTSRNRRRISHVSRIPFTKAGNDGGESRSR